jgi:hypothetical protein
MSRYSTSAMNVTQLLHGPLQHDAFDEKLRAAADISVTLADQINELLELRDAVRTAELAALCRKPSSKKLPVRPGRLFMQTLWLMGRNSPSA